MNSLFAAGLFDQPWLVAGFIVVGLISNWLMKRRQEKEAGPAPEGKPQPAPGGPQGGFNLEETLRRLMEESSPPKAPVPPPIIPTTATVRPSSTEDWQDAEAVPSRQSWREEASEARTDARRTAVRIPTPPRPTPAARARTEGTIVSPSAEQAQAARRFAQLNEQGRHPAIAVHGTRRSRPGSPAAYWRNPRNARQAFVASLVFGPPKGLEA